MRAFDAGEVVLSSGEGRRKGWICLPSTVVGVLWYVVLALLVVLLGSVVAIVFAWRRVDELKG